MQGECSIYRILLDISHRSVRDTVPSGGSADGSVHIAPPAVS